MQTRSFQPADLEYFIEICRLGSIAQAAIQLGVTQPALSKAVRRLEQIAGARLLNRSARGVSPTDMGQILLQRASLILSELDTTRSLLQELSGVRTGSVAMGVAPALNHDFVPGIIERALRQRPGLHFRVSEGLFQALIPQLQQGGLDFIISSPTPAETLASDLHCETLGHSLFAACVGDGHPLSRAHAVADLSAYDWVLAPPRGVLRDHLNAIFRQRGLAPPQPKVETSSITLSKTLIMRQGFIGFLPLAVFAAEEQAGQIKRLALPWLDWRREFVMLSRRSRALTPAAEYVIGLIHSHAGCRINPA